ncbi:MAG: ISAs1 family transposase [Steroidobacteraceae bacterium]
MLPVKGAADQLKQTNEIKVAIPLLHSCRLDLKDKDITVDALLTQRSLATWLRSGQAHYHFTVKGNQPILLADLQRYFLARREPAYTHTCAGHGRIETRCIWVTEALNGYLEFPHVHQAFLIQRQVIEKKTGKTSCELAYGITSRPASEASPQRLLQINRGHWTIGVSSRRTRLLVGESPTEAKRPGPRSLGGIVAREQDDGALRQHTLKGA